MTAIVCTAIVTLGIVIIFSVRMGLRYAAQLDGFDKEPEPCPEITDVTRGHNKIPGKARCQLPGGHSGPHKIEMLGDATVGWYPHYWHTEPKKLPENELVGFFVRENDVTLYIDENGEGFRYKQYPDGRQKFVRHPSGADIADIKKRDQIFQLWVRWMKLGAERNRMLNGLSYKDQAK